MFILRTLFMVPNYRIECHLPLLYWGLSEYWLLWRKGSSVLCRRNVPQSQTSFSSVN
jgi:hypothetical protein